QRPPLAGPSAGAVLAPPFCSPSITPTTRCSAKWQLGSLIHIVAALEPRRSISEFCQSMTRRSNRLSSEPLRGHRLFAVGSSTRRIQVEYYIPSYQGRCRQVLFVLHGVQRNPESYLEPWTSFADATGCAVFAPLFSAEEFPGSRSYNQGNVLSIDEILQPRDTWSFQVIEDLFDEVRAWCDSQASTYAVFGHSAGAQFAHRMLLLSPDLRASIVVAANSGWYTLPTYELDYPYGLSGISVPKALAKRAIESNLVLLLGEDDKAIDDPHLRTSPLAMEQGAHRLERGLNFYLSGQSAATRLDTNLGWTARRVPRVGHDQAAMAITASSILAEYLS
ncbi:MAG: hypothetical protein P8R46_04075, partial [Planctomycetota bacterium]|nr:hypothetical protein [Planctomycetota bacterium]